MVDAPDWLQGHLELQLPHQVDSEHQPQSEGVGAFLAATHRQEEGLRVLPAKHRASHRSQATLEVGFSLCNKAQAMTIRGVSIVSMSLTCSNTSGMAQGSQLGGGRGGLQQAQFIMIMRFGIVSILLTCSNTSGVVQDLVSFTFRTIGLVQTYGPSCCTNPAAKVLRFGCCNLAERCHAQWSTLGQCVVSHGKVHQMNNNIQSCWCCNCRYNTVGCSTRGS